MIGQKKIDKKFVLISVCVVAFVCCSAIGWALAYSLENEVTPMDQSNDIIEPEIFTPEQIRDTTMEYIENNHPDVVPFLGNLEWTGGIVETGLLGAGLYRYESQGWTMEISYPIVADPIYDITVNYSVPSGIISIPYSVNWEGTWENCSITETDYVFVQ